jgi:hypothetical protein
LFGPISSVPVLRTREGIAGIIATNFSSQTVSFQVRKEVLSTDYNGLVELMTRNFVSQLNVHTHIHTELWRKGGKIGSTQANVKILLGPKPDQFLIPLKHLVE